MDETTQDNETTCIVMSLEAKFHKIHEEGKNSKLIQFPRGGILWGLHLSLQKTTDGTTSKVVGSLICFGPMKEHSPDWTIIFDHVFTISYKRVGWGGSIKKGCCFSDTQHIINNYEWDGQSSPSNIDWDSVEDLKLSCHLYISKTTGFDRHFLKEGASLTTVHDYMSIPTSQSQVECQVTKVFSDLLADERIVFTDDCMEAVDKLATFFSYPHVIETCRMYLMICQSGIFASFGIPRKSEFDLSGFDYKENSPDRKARMSSLRESDIVEIFQQLCSIAFRKP